MRVHPWIVSVLSVLALSMGQSSYAQFDGMGGAPMPEGSPYYPTGPGFADGSGGFVPPPPVAPAGAWDPIAAGQNGGPGYRPDRLPWPHISPFENQFAEHTHEGELWFYQANNSGRSYFTNVDYRMATYRRPDVTFVGFARGPFPDFVPNPMTQGGGGGGQGAQGLSQFALNRFDFLPVDTGVFFDSFLGNQGLVNTIAVNEQHGESDPQVNGFNVEWGFKEPDGTGLLTSLWYTPDAQWSYSRGFNPPQGDAVTGANFNNGQPLVITNSIQLNDGSPSGSVIQFDKFFGLNFETVGGGGDLNWLFSPFWRGDWYRFSPTAGVQFTYIGEDFSFRGADSGLITTAAPGTLTFSSGTLTQPAAFATGNAGILTPFDPDPVVAVPAYEMQIQSEVDSYLFGPQIGLQFEVGGKNLKIIGKSHIGLAANHEKIRVRSFGVGNPDVLNGSPGRDPNLPLPQASAPNPFYDPNTRFEEFQDHTRLSPTTAHQITAEANLFQYIPVIRRIHWLEEARFRVGYQINAAFEIQRPNRVIEYNGFPLIPTIRNDQETRWYTESVNLGVHWVY